MTDEEIDQIVEATGPPSGGSWTAPFRRFATWFVATRIGRWMIEKTARWQTVVAILVMASGFPLVIASIGATNDHQRLSDLRDVQRDLYFAQVVNYTQDVAAYNLCLDGIGRSDANRAQWDALADFISALDTGSGRAIAFADQIRHGPLLSAAPRTDADCPDPGPAPVPPTTP